MKRKDTESVGESAALEPQNSIHSIHKTRFDHESGGENPLTTGVKQAVPYRTGREAWYLSVSTEKKIRFRRRG